MKSLKHEGGGGYFLKTTFLLRILAYLANFVPLILTVKEKCRTYLTSNSSGLDGQNQAELTRRAVFGLLFTHGEPLLLRYSRMAMAKLLSKLKMN